ncbi:hypothetical protein JCM1393_06560 [Clostridium carnis]
MEFIKIMNISDNELYNAIVDSILYDINETTKNNISKKKLKSGYSYVKEMNTKAFSKGNVKVIIEELTEPKVYAARFVSGQGDNYLRYEIKKINEDKIEVKYIEEFKGSSKINNWNYNILSRFYKKKFFKRAEKTLANMERWITENRNKK